MTPFGEELRRLRRENNVKQADLAHAIGLSAAYMSALEHGKRGKPSRELVHQICSYFGLIWEDADKLQQLADRSHPKVTVNTAGLDARATECANLLAETIGGKTPQQLEELHMVLLRQKLENQNEPRD